MITDGFYSQKGCSKFGFEYKSNTQIGLDHISIISSLIQDAFGEEQKIIIAGDGAYSFDVHFIQDNDKKVSLIARGRADTALYKEPPVEETKRRGLPRKYGDKVATLEELLASYQTQNDTSLKSRT
jgi:hypothetical protein